MEWVSPDSIVKTRLRSSFPVNRNLLRSWSSNNSPIAPIKVVDVDIMWLNTIKLKFWLSYLACYVCSWKLIENTVDDYLVNFSAGPLQNVMYDL
jgi:hypothetical protein